MPPRQDSRSEKAAREMRNMQYRIRATAGSTFSSRRGSYPFHLRLGLRPPGWHTSSKRVLQPQVREAMATVFDSLSSTILCGALTEQDTFQCAY